MFDAVVFSSVNALEFLEVRRNVVRIPEVIRRIREAQAIWDEVSPQNLDLLNFVGSDDSVFLGHLRLKNLTTAVIQLGLFERFLNQNGGEGPRFALGLVNGDSALKVATRQQTFDELIRQSPALSAPRAALALQIGGLPVLSGISLAEFGLCEMCEEGANPLVEGEMDLRRTMSVLAEKKEIEKVIVIGPGAGHVQAMLKELRKASVEVVDSIELDPVLAWFWPKKDERVNQMALS